MSWVPYTVGYIVGVVLFAGIGLAIVTVLNQKKVSSIGEVFDFMGSDGGEYGFGLTMCALFWPFAAFVLAVGLALFLLAGPAYLIFRGTQWALFELFHARKNVPQEGS